MSDIEVTVFCISYNHGKYIRDALDSIVSQKTNFKFEILIFDDASTDDSQKIIREYNDKYPGLFVLKLMKKNTYGNRPNIESLMLPYVHGKYVAMCECDDFWTDSNKLQLQYDALEANPDCSLCTHKVLCCNEDKTYNSRKFPDESFGIKGTKIISQDALADYYWKPPRYPFHTSSYFMRKDVFASKLDYPSDAGILRKAFLLGNVFYYDKAMSMRRLFPVGGFTYTVKKSGDKGIDKQRIHQIDHEYNFDKYSNYKYTSYIRLARYLLYSHMYQKDLKKEIKKKYHISLLDTFKNGNYKDLTVYKILFQQCIYFKLYYRFPKFGRNISKILNLLRRH